MIRLQPLYLPLFLLFFSSTCFAKLVELDWTLSWVNRAPDGFTRPVIAINKQWPLPVVQASVGDRLRIHVTNKLGNETSGVHWHGLPQRGTNNMDGSGSMQQCPIPPGSTFTYEFDASTSGTYWYHSHEKGQYPDGLRAPLVIHDPQWESGLGFAEEFLLTVSDWYHSEMPPLIRYYQSKDNLDRNGGAEPLPQSGLINDGGQSTFKLQPGKKYLFRSINISAMTAFYLKFDQHDITVVSIDGVKVQPRTVQSLFIIPAQRYTFLITAKPNPDRNYAFVAKMARASFRNATLPSDLEASLNQDGVLQYGTAFPKPAPLRIADNQFAAVDDALLLPLDGQKILEPVSKTINMNLKFTDYPFGRRSQMGKVPFILPDRTPTLYTALTTGDEATEPEIYGDYVNPFVLEKDEIYQVVLDNTDTMAHPMHLHSHDFQTVYRSLQRFNGSNEALTQTPMVRDTVGIPPGGSLVMRFKADRPGVNLYHCHVEWHMGSGMAVTFIEAPDVAQRQFQGLRNIPEDHLQVCRDQNTSVRGNCAGNSDAYEDLEVCNNPKRLARTARGALIDGDTSLAPLPEARRSRRRKTPKRQVPEKGRTTVEHSDGSG